MHEKSPESILPTASGIVLRLLVRNHAGVMSHICGLFSRRGFNVEGIACMPRLAGAHSVVLLLVMEDVRLDQCIRQLRKLVDVFEVEIDAAGQAAFAGLRAQLDPAPKPDGLSEHRT